MEVKRISLSSIRENKWNPNKMKPALFESLKLNIQKSGYLQPIIVRPVKSKKRNDEKYEIIDGAHRFRAINELGYSDAECLVLNLTTEESKLLTVTMNRLRGEFDYTGLAEVLKSLSISDSDIEKYLAFTVKEQKEILSLLEAPVINESAGIGEGSNILVEFLLTLDEEKIVERAVVEESKKSNKTRGAALAHICRKYLETNHIKISADKSAG
ncbi:MAG: ParB/RepB/Spo0J family partition protein [Planctomycetota bacterium]